VHDVVALRFPETMTPWSRIYGRATLRAVLDAADLIVVPSHDTADDLNSLVGIKPDRVRVVWNGVDEIFFSAPGGRPVHSRPYVLFVGTPEPRKNLARLTDAMRILNDRGASHRLVIAGGEGWGHLRLGPDVEMLGRVSDEDLHALYANASCLAIPSLHEGFGLPVIEAMAAGTPVVAGNRGALPEIAGNAAVLVDPYDIDSIAVGIETAIANRERLIGLGKSRAAQFSWATAAAAMEQVYKELV
jgi:glycosyltransferase involved in cell wall biosynthesis